MMTPAARAYILRRISQRREIDLREVSRLTGLRYGSAQQFVSAVQDEAAKRAGQGGGNGYTEAKLARVLLGQIR